MDDPRDTRPVVPPGNAQVLQFPKPGGVRGPSVEAAKSSANGAGLSASALFGLLWHALADVLGTAAAATLLRRAAQRAALEFPELSALSISRGALEYHYQVPAEWQAPAAELPPPLCALVRELWALLVVLTGSVVVNRIAQVPELRECGLLPPRRAAIMKAPPPILERLTTGSAAFDRILDGGIPARSVNVIAGQPGAGKTLFSLQMLFALARQGKKGLYFTTLAEPSLKLLQYLQQFSFFDESLLESSVVFADLGSVIRRKGADATMNEIASRVEGEAPALVVIDSFKAIRDILGDVATLRTFVYDLAVHTASWGATSLLVGEYTEAEIASNAEFAIADGIVRFSNARHELTAIREVEVLKMRGAGYATGGHFYEIGAEGLRFFPRVRGPESPVASSAKTSERPVATQERVSTGVAGLDAMLGGGLLRTSTTVVQGGTGTGKTLLGLQFLLEGARRGEAGILFMLEETPDQVRGFAQSLGWELRLLEESGLLTLSYVSPVELSPDRFLDRARHEVERLAVRHAVLDSLTSMALGVPSNRRFKELVYAMAKDFHARGISLQMNMEVADLLGTGQLSGHGVSFAADNVIQLKYVEIAGRLERGISVLKARGVRHATDARRLSVEPGGVKVAEAFEGLRGVLTGLPVPVPEGAKG